MFFLGNITEVPGEDEGIEYSPRGERESADKAGAKERVWYESLGGLKAVNDAALSSNSSGVVSVAAAGSAGAASAASGAASGAESGTDAAKAGTKPTSKWHVPKTIEAAVVDEQNHDVYGNEEFRFSNSYGIKTAKPGVWSKVGKEAGGEGGQSGNAETRIDDLKKEHLAPG